MMNWQPIETAPKDGTRILVMMRRSVHIARWESTAKTYDDPYWHTEDPINLVTQRHNPPKVWMPLPKGP